MSLIIHSSLMKNGVMLIMTFKKGNKEHLTHGKRDTRWANMKTRCFNKNDPHFARYGAKGIRVCDEWAYDFKCFYDWAMVNGYRDDLTIDRIDNRSGYEPSNCRWVSTAEQNRNKQNVRFIRYGGKTQTIGQWTNELGLGKETIRERLKRGWTEKQAIEGKKVINP